MATVLKPPSAGDERETPTGRSGHVAPPPVGPAPRADGPPFRIGPLFGVVGILSFVLMALMVTTNYLMLRDGRAVATGPVGAAAVGSVAAQPGPSSAGGPAALAVTASEFKFAPAEFRMGGPGDLTVTYTNAGSIEHDFVIEGIDGTIVVKPGQSATKTFAIAKAGMYSFVCSIPGHKDAGMKGTLTVGDVAAMAVKPDTSAYQPIPTEGAIAGEPAVALKPAVAGATALPLPTVAPPVNRTAPALVTLDLETRAVTARMADGVTYTYWTFGGTVPGPMLRVRQGDTVELSLKNADPQVTHSIDLHAVTGPGGGAKVMQIPPGETGSFRFQALNPGVYVYHCATPMVAHHIANGMYGLIVVEPPGGYPTVDHEFYVMQGDFYPAGKRGQEGQHEFSIEKMLDERPEYVLFNGSVGALTGPNALKAKVGETVRIFFGVGGPNLSSSFHVIGEIFDRVWVQGATEPSTNVQTTMVPPGGATVVEFTVQVPGNYTLVDHSLGRLEKGAAGVLTVEGPENPAIFQSIHQASPGGGGH